MNLHGQPPVVVVNNDSWGGSPREWAVQSLQSKKLCTVGAIKPQSICSDRHMPAHMLGKNRTWAISPCGKAYLGADALAKRIDRGALILSVNRTDAISTTPF